MPVSLLLASNNQHKVEELRAALRDVPVRVVSPRDLGLSLEPNETAGTFEGNARIKAEAFRDAANMLAIADDSGLVVDALGGAPGVLSARYGGPEATDTDRNVLVLEQLAGVETERRSARFVAVIAVAAPGEETRLFRGEVEGCIAVAERGNHGFGYDPIFFYPPFDATFGEVSSMRKAEVSHRSVSMWAAIAYLTGPDGPLY